MAKRKRKRRWHGGRIIVMAAIALLIAGFLIRRTVVPRTLHYLAYQPVDHGPMPAPDYPPSPVPAARPAGAPGNAPGAAVSAVQNRAPESGEHLSDSDRQQLDEILRRKAK